MSSSTAPSVWNAVEIEIRGANRSIAHSSTASGSSPSNATESSPASRSSSSSTLMCLPPCQTSDLVVCRAVAKAAEGLAVAAALDPARDEGPDSLVELFRRDALEDRECDRRGPVEAAAQEDVVSLVALSFGIANGRALEPEIADPMMGAGVSAAVEVQAEPVDGGP